MVNCNKHFQVFMRVYQTYETKIVTEVNVKRDRNRELERDA